MSTQIDFGQFAMPGAAVDYLRKNGRIDPDSIRQLMGYYGYFNPYAQTVELTCGWSEVRSMAEDIVSRDRTQIPDMTEVFGLIVENYPVDKNSAYSWDLFANAELYNNRIVTASIIENYGKLSDTLATRVRDAVAKKDEYLAHFEKERMEK